MQHLPLEVRLVHGVVVDDPEPADSSRGEVQRRRGSEPTGADQEHARLEKPFLPGLADLRDQQVAAVAASLLVIQARRHLDG